MVELHSDNSTPSVNADRTHVDWPVENLAKSPAQTAALAAPAGRPTMRGALLVLAAVAAEYQVSVDDLRGKDRHRTIAEARQLACWLLRQTRKLSYPEIGIVLSRDHTTAMSAVSSIERKLKTDPSLAETAERMRDAINGTRPTLVGFDSGRFA